jgi:preprotein translocase subunit YajC
MGLLFIIPMFLIMYMLLIRPQQKRVREQQALQRAVDVGDEIITTSGIYGVITAMDDEDMWIEVADGIEFRMARGAVLRRVQQSDAPSEPTDAAEAADEAEPTHDEKN